MRVQVSALMRTIGNLVTGLDDQTQKVLDAGVLPLLRDVIERESLPDKVRTLQWFHKCWGWARGGHTPMLLRRCCQLAPASSRSAVDRIECCGGKRPASCASDCVRGVSGLRFRTART